MDAREIKLIITPQEDGGTLVKLEMDVDIPIKTALVGLEMGKQQMMDAFTNYCENNKDKSPLHEYHNMKVNELYNEN